MYCLEKLQRELAYFFDMDLRELPRVQDLLTAKGYTQVQKGDEIIKLEPSAQAASTLAYTDTKGHTHQIPSDIAQQWLETFGLKDLQETYTPQFSEQVAQALEPILQGSQITLSANSLVKLMQRDRLEFLPYIKETLEHSDIIIKDKENALIFAKDIGQTSYFTSVSKNDKGEWVISTNSYKTLSQLKNRVSENGEVLYLSKEAPNILAETFTTKAFSNELASEIIPQSTAPLSKEAQEYAHKILQGLRKTAQTPLNKLADEEPYSTDRGFMLRNARYKKQMAQELADNFANLHWVDLRTAIRYAKTPYNEAMYKELKESIESKEFAKFIESSYPPKPTQKSLFDEADSSEAPPSKINFTYTTGEAKGIAELRKDLKAALEPSLNKEIVNKEQGLSGVITTEEVKKIMSSKAVAKSVANGFSRDEHIEVAKHIERLFTESKLLRSHKDYKENPNILQVHRFIKDIEVNGKEANALITLFEKMQGKNKIYTIELESLESTPLSTQAKSAGAAVKAQSAAATPTEAAPIAKTDGESIAHKLQTLKSKKEKILKQIDEYKHKHNIPSFTGFGNRAIQIDDPHYQSLHAEYSDLTKQIQALQQQLARQATPQTPPPSKLESTKVSASPNPYPDFETTPQSWSDIEKIKGQDYIDSLKQWHKHSHKSSKNTDGSPKVFYHGTRSDKFEVFEAGESESGRDGIYFSTSPNIAKDYDVWDQGVYEVFLHYKNPLEIDFKGAPYNSKQGREILKTIPQKLSKDHDALIYKNIRDNNQQGAGELADTIVVFEPNQIKHIENRGIESEQGRKYFNESSPNIFHSNPHAGAGLLGGSAAGVEQDENGNITFSPEKFALGLLGGTVGSKAVAKGLEWRANKVAKSYPNIAKDNPTLMQEIAKRDLQTYAMTNTHNALTRFLNNNKLFDINPQLFAGEKALVNEAYAPHKARLERAKELESSGADEIEIWEKTGWYKDKDKKWKFEISQKGGEFDFSGLEFYTFSRDNRVKLSRILKDDELFTAYPSLKNLIVNFDYGMNDYNLGSYAKYTKEITLNAKQLRDNQSRLSTLYHEIQHAIQDIEGFGFGYKEAENLRGISQESVERYAKQHGEVEARNVADRLSSYRQIFTKKDLEKEIQEYKDLIKDLETDKELQQSAKERIAKLETLKLKDDEIYNERLHPHKTMDTPLKDTIAEATMQGEALSKELESSFLDSSGKIDYKA